MGHLSAARNQPKQMRYWNAVAASRMNRALSGYRPGIERVTSQNAAALFASSGLTAVYLFRTSVMDFIESEAGTPSCGARANEVAGRMMSSVIKTMWGLRGPLEVLMGGWSWLVNGEMLPVASRKWWPKMRKPASPLARDEDERLRRIENLWMRTDRQYDPHSNYLGQALDLLRDTYALVSQLLEMETSQGPHKTGVLVDRAAIFSWVTLIPREYIQLVEAQDRDALVILAHYAVLLTRTNTVWWLEGLGSNFVTAIAIALGPEHRRLIEWPVRVTGVNLPFNASSSRSTALGI
ncbi:hypothetical protein EKO04_008548 [Ascochyta lentis]|uniref:Uncharacterized protein n=1 Tax=Ascochyta lentis TaxID=205686 RepID=A0A8H7IYM4_9PLEO|nr:hypothetical protein EKO04_008548 [Ascochyta lentis]